MLEIVKRRVEEAKETFVSMLAREPIGFSPEQKARIVELHALSVDMILAMVTEDFTRAFDTGMARIVRARTDAEFVFSGIVDEMNLPTGQAEAVKAAFTEAVRVYVPGNRAYVEKRFAQKVAARDLGEAQKRLVLGLFESTFPLFIESLGIA